VYRLSTFCVSTTQCSLVLSVSSLCFRFNRLQVTGEELLQPSTKVPDC